MNYIAVSSDRAWDGHGWGVPWFGLTFLLLLVIAGGIAIYAARRRTAVPAGNADAGAKAEHVLALRFARGDIDEVEYEARLTTLRASRPEG